MTKVILISILFITLVLNSCRVKEDCEIFHTGKIFVSNNTGSSIEVFIDNNKVFSLETGETKSVDRAIGSYSVKCLAFPDEWIYDVTVIECESVEINVPE